MSARPGRVGSVGGRRRGRRTGPAIAGDFALPALSASTRCPGKEQEGHDQGRQGARMETAWQLGKASLLQQPFFSCSGNSSRPAEESPAFPLLLPEPSDGTHLGGKLAISCGPPITDTPCRIASPTDQRNATETGTGQRRSVHSQNKTRSKAKDPSEHPDHRECRHGHLGDVQSDRGSAEPGRP